MLRLFRTLKEHFPAKDAIKALGIVFGDIGTSPIYTLTVTFALITVTTGNVFGILSLIVWTLILLVTVQYAWLAMSLSQKGEGGTIVLREILVPLASSKIIARVSTFLSFVGISFLIGDGVITPAISILSAVEGLPLIPAFAAITTGTLMALACFISVVLFAFQRWGTERVSIFFGPIMTIWFIALGASGIFWIVQEPSVLQAIHPYYAYHFMKTNGIAAFLVLSKVILCATGGEALYADMGHLGRIPIIRAWGFAFIVLVISYLGQGAFLLLHPHARERVFHEMIFTQAPSTYIPFLILSVIATVIASQAMISGIFSIVYQGITTGIMPKLKVDYTSRKLRSQIYIPSVNWALLTLVLLAILEFKQSEHLANAYGLAAICTMTITSILMSTIFALKRLYGKMTIAIFIGLINIAFLLSSIPKIPQGAYWSLIIALLPLSLILIYTAGKRRLYQGLRPVSLHDFLGKYTVTITKEPTIQGTALFFSKAAQKIPSYIAHTMFANNIIYEDNIIVTVITQDKPFGVTAFFKDLAPGLRSFEIRVGYMEILNMEKILRNAQISPKVIFYGMEDIETKHILWSVFALIKKLTPSFVQFHKLPAHKLHGVVVRVTM